MGVGSLVLLEVLKVAHDSEWGSPSFSQAKTKSNQLSFLSYFRNLNKQLKQKPSPMPKINEMLLKLEGLSMLRHLIETWDTFISELAKTKVIDVRSFSCGENIVKISTNGS